MNKVVLIGRLTDDVELRYTANGVAVGNFTLAVQRKFKDQNGDYQADFIRCTVWRKVAENLAQYQKKGDRIGVSGAIETGSYDDKETGKKVYTTQVRVDEVDFLSPIKQQGQQQGNPYQNNQQQANQQQNQNGGQPNPYQQQGGQPNPYQQQGQVNQQQQNPFGGGQGQPIDIGDDNLPF